ncbi:cytochrome P450 [Serendipita vermifera]|nr:cytochrome P450 [Serendipita vermifera]
MNHIFPSPLVDSPIKTAVVSLGLASLCYLTVTKIQNAVTKRNDKHAYPPGPPREPLIGAMRSFPKDRFFQRFDEWADTYGDIVYAPIPGMDVVILNSYDVAQELLSKRPNSTGGRRAGFMVLDLMELPWNTSLLQPSESHSNQRKILRRGIGPQRVGNHDPLIESEVAKLIGNPNLTVQEAVGRMVSKMAYGERIWKEMGNEPSHWNLELMELISEAFFSFWLVDIFHFLRFLPGWFTNLRFKQLSREARDLSRKVRHNAYKRGAELYKSGELDHSLLHDLLEEFGEQEDAQDATAILYLAASDTVRPFVKLC